MKRCVCVCVLRGMQQQTDLEKWLRFMRQVRGTRVCANECQLLVYE